MSLTVETGQGLSAAESYVSVADADARLASLGMTNWATLITTEKEQALRRATAHMEQAYRQRWKGTRLTRTQSLSWPRYGACVDGYDIPSTIVPADIANACADLALKAAAGDLAADESRAVIREKVGPLETEYSPHSPQATRYVAIDRALSPYLKAGGNVAFLVRS